MPLVYRVANFDYTNDRPAIRSLPSCGTVLAGAGSERNNKPQPFMEAYLGTILPVGFNFAPYGWMMCQGQLLPISQYAALFSLLGVNFGGNGQSNFGLPDLQGRMALGFGDGPGLPINSLGDTGGATSQTIMTTSMPAHSHGVQCASAGAASANGTAAGNYPATITDSNGNPITGYVPDSNSATLTMNPMAVSVTGNGIPFATQPPYLGLNFIICMSGIFPARS